MGVSIADNFRKVDQRRIAACERAGRDPKEVTLIAVTKTHPVEAVNEAIDAGATDVGENKAQEVLAKYDDAKPVRWHFIGHLQTNKVKSIIDKVVLIHSVDSLHLAKEIDKRAGNIGKVMDILIEINIGDEESKSGAAYDDVVPLIEEIQKNYHNVRVRGLMCVPPLGGEPEDSRPYFRKTRKLFDELKNSSLTDDSFDILSMGMSADFEVAIEEGATMIRVGSAIFGPRNYR